MSKSTKLRACASGLVMMFVVAGGSQLARGGSSLGDAANCAVLYEGAGNHNLQINSTPFNGSTISGNIGIEDENGGRPQFQPSNPAVIKGNVNFAVPVPEPGTFLAGALMLVPFGVGIIGFVRKYLQRNRTRQT